MNLNEYITEHQNIALDAINALRITGYADNLADSLAERLEQLGEPPQDSRLGNLLQDAISLAGEAINLADLYSGSGGSESVREFTKQLEKLEQKVDASAELTPRTLTHGDYLLADNSGWFETSNGFVVWISTTHEGISVEVYDAAVLRLGNTDPLASCSAFTAELAANGEEVEA
jgi:hypothetical protein